MSDTPEQLLQALLNSPAYSLAEEDVDFPKLNAMRSVRMQLELHKVELAFEQHQIDSTIMVFGGTQIVERGRAEQRLEAAQAELAASPQDETKRRAILGAERIKAKCKYYDDAREFARLVSTACK